MWEDLDPDPVVSDPALVPTGRQVSLQEVIRSRGNTAVPFLLFLI